MKRFAFLVLLCFAACRTAPPSPAPNPQAAPPPEKSGEKPGAKPGAKTAAQEAGAPGSGGQARVVAPRLRLPSGMRPTHFTAELAIDPKSDDFEGRGEVELLADAPASLVWLNADGLKILDTEPRSTVFDAQPGFVGLQLEQPLPAGASTLKLHWQGKVSRIDNQGLFRQRENGQWYVLSQGEPLGMRKVIPCFDEPSFKIPWKISLRVPKADAAYFNTPQEASEDQGEVKVVRFVETKPLPSYLLAFGVGPFERVDAGKIQSGAPLGVIVTSGKTEWAKYSVQSSPKLMNLLEGYFRLPYQYPKLDLIEVPVGGGAMENPGLITFAQRINLAKPGTDTPQFFRRAAHVEAHEMAHLWFGDLVTAAWWDDIWLNEAFATWMTLKAIEQFAPAWSAPAERVAQTQHAMEVDSLLSARRIRQPVESVGDIKTAFDAITYQKGAAVIGMFEQWVGAEQFRKGVTRYLTEHRDGNATAKEFLAAISAESGKDVAPAFSTFLDQGGLPLVSAKVACEGTKGTIELSQARYLPLGAGPAGEQLWQIPICMRSDLGPLCTLLTEKTGKLALEGCPRWVVPNAGASGYYRSSLDDDALAKLTKNVARLTVPERMTFFADVVAAAHSGATDIGRSLQMVQALAGDRDRHVIEGLLPLLRAVRHAGILPDDARFGFGAFVRQAFSKRARALGMRERKNEPDDARILRPQLLRLEGDEGLDPTVRADARKLSLQWLSDHGAASPELASAVLYLAALDADGTLWEKLHAAAKAEQNRVERQRILEAMGAVRNPELAEKNFALFLTDEFDSREAMPLLFGANNDAGTRVTLWEFVKKNLTAIDARLPQDFGQRVPLALSGFCDDDHAAAVAQFFRPHIPDHPGLDRTLSQVVEEIRQCAAFKAKQGPALVAFLKN
jgi:alanyl aminopeptidase